jgi:hypothetical protein
VIFAKLPPRLACILCGDSGLRLRQIALDFFPVTRPVDAMQRVREDSFRLKFFVPAPGTTRRKTQFPVISCQFQKPSVRKPTTGNDH